MATKPVSPGKKTTRRKSAAAAKLTEGGATSVLESEPPASAVDPEMRRRLVAAEAYFRAERRGFAAGHELEDWVAAEAVVDSQLRQTRAA